MTENPASLVFDLLRLFVNVVSALLMIGVPCGIAAIALLIRKIQKDVKTYLETPEFTRMKADKDDIPSTATALPVSGLRDGEDCAIYIGGGELFLPRQIVTNQGGTAMTEAKMKYLRIAVRDITAVTRLGVGRKRGTVSYMMFTVIGLHKPIAIYSGRGLGDPPPELFDTHQLLKLIGRPPVEELGIVPIYKLFRFM